MVDFKTAEGGLRLEIVVALLHLYCHHVVPFSKYLSMVCCGLARDSNRWYDIFRKQLSIFSSIALIHIVLSIHFIKLCASDPQIVSNEIRPSHNTKTYLRCDHLFDSISVLKAIRITLAQFCRMIWHGLGSNTEVYSSFVTMYINPVITVI